MSTIVVDEAVLRALIAEEVTKALEPVLEALKERQKGPHEGFLTSQDLASLLSIDARTLRRLREAGEIPQPIIIGDRMLRWPRSVIDQWIRGKEQRFALARSKQAGSM